VAQAFVDEVTAIVKRETDISVLDKASAATIVYNARNEMLTYIGISTAAGFALVCGVVVLLDILSVSLVTVKDASLHGKLEVIGVIPDYKNLNG
jgi:capsular polysaccharide biosynthesis protein